MQLLKKHGILIFWLCLAANCFFLYRNNTAYFNVTKVLLIPILMSFLFFNARKNYNRTFKLYFFIGLIAAWIGDILLIFNTNLFFILGSLSFIITYVLYSMCFAKLKSLNIAKCQEAFLGSIGIAIIIFQLFSFLNAEQNMGSLKYPFLVYMIFLGIMAVFSINILSSSGRKSLATNYFIPACGLFLLSAATLGLNKFYFIGESRIEFLEIVVILSYGYAQCLMVQGFSKIVKG